MWMTTKLAIGGLVLAMAALDSAPVSAQSVIKPAKVQAASADNGVLVVSRGVFPRTERVEVSRGKSLMVQFPFVLRDVLVSDPGRLDAVVQSSDRVFLIAKKMGEVNVFFFNDKGDHVLTLDVDVGAGKGLLSSSEGKDNAVERALQSLNEMLANLVPGSRIISKRVGHSVILTGSVPNAASSSRAATIAREDARAWINQTQSESARVSSTSSESSGTWQRGEEGGSGNRRSSSESESESYSKTTVNPNQKDEKLVINLLTIEGGEQVMIQVVVAEVQRSIMKQFGINLGAQINSGNFATALLTENALPLTAAAGLGKLPIPGLGTGTGAGCLAGGTLCSWNQGPASGTYGNSGFNGGFGSANNRMNYAMRMMERDGLIRTLAEPNLTAVSGETAKFLAGGEYPIPVVDASGQQSVTYKEYGVGVAFTPVVLSEGRISLKIETEVSELTDVGGVTLSSISIPACAMLAWIAWARSLVGELLRVSMVTLNPSGRPAAVRSSLALATSSV